MSQTSTRITNLISNIETYTEKLKLFVGNEVKLKKLNNVSSQSHYSAYSLIENELEIIYTGLQAIAKVLDPISNVSSAIPPQTITIDDSVSGTVTVSWTSVSDAQSYKVLYRVLHETAWEETPLYEGPLLTVTNALLADEDYQLVIQSKGLDGVWGEYSSVEDFTIATT